MKTDARAILNRKLLYAQQRKRQSFQKQPFTKQSFPKQGVIDARQILKLKQRSFAAKSGFQRTSRGGVSAVTLQNQGFVKRTFNKDWTDVKRVPDNQVLPKHVHVQRGGMITVTSGPQHLKTLDLEKKVLASKSSITITTLNKNVPKRQLPTDDDDDLEKMTLEDLPEMRSKAPELKKLKTLRTSAHRLDSWQPSSTSSRFQSPLSSRLQSQIDSLVANTPSSQQGYTVLVTNLHNSVTHEDIMELFGDIGTMSSAQLLQPGTALVVYFSKEEAVQACETYHNRLLDGQPMQCTLLPSSAPSRPSLSSRLGNRLSSPLHSSSALSQRFGSLHQNEKPPSLGVLGSANKSGSRNVKFTVTV